MALLLFRLVVVWKPDCAEKRELTELTGKLLMAMPPHTVVGSHTVNRRSSL